MVFRGIILDFACCK